MSQTRLTAEFDWLKIFALLLLIFVHSDLYFAFPEIIQSVQCFLLSCFFFIGGFLTFTSFHKREASVRGFFKSKMLTLYFPFMAAAVFYFALEITIGGISFDPLRLLFQVSMLNIFDEFNSVYNWGSLWFIPYLLAFMLILVLLEKYICNSKYQILAGSVLWLSTILTWVYNPPLQFGQVFSQYFLIFAIGFWVNKLNAYDRITHFATAGVAAPVFTLSSLNFSGLFTFSNTAEALKSLLYSNGRSVLLGLSAVLLALFLLRKLQFPHNRFVKTIAATSIFIYLLEPFASYVLRSHVFWDTTIYFTDGLPFYLYLTTRIIVILVLLPLAISAVRILVPKAASLTVKSKRLLLQHLKG